jgi:hypothetical protein
LARYVTAQYHIDSAGQPINVCPGVSPRPAGHFFCGGSHSVETGLGQPLPTTSLESIVDMRLEHFCYADLLGLKGTPGTVTRDAIVDFLSLFSIQSEHWQTPCCRIADLCLPIWLRRRMIFTLAATLVRRFAPALVHELLGLCHARSDIQLAGFSATRGVCFFSTPSHYVPS